MVAEPFEAIVRGLFVEARVGGGYMVQNGTIPAGDPYAPQLAGETEGLGGGALVHLALGYDITELFSLQAVGGMTLASSRRRKLWVRDLALSFGGAAVRLAFDLGDRLDLLISGGGGYAMADNGVDAPQKGPVAFGGLGVEYYTHVRHFSLGLELAVLAPLSPKRLFVSLAPQLKYTF